VLDPELVDEALVNVEEVYHLAGLPGMWRTNKADFNAVNCRGTEVVLAAASKRRVRRLLHCSTESILFGRSTKDSVIAEHTEGALDEMPGAYTRSKLMAEQRARQAAACGAPVVIVSPTMLIGPGDRHSTPPTAMLHYFLRRRIQIYLDFVMNLVDVRDVAAGMILAMENGLHGHRYILGGQNISLKQLLRLLSSISGRSSLRIPIPGRLALATSATMEFIATHMTHRAPAATTEGVRIALQMRALSIEKSRRELGYEPRPIEPALRETIASMFP
jgi:dihydroflavonol-4-reductase